MLFVYTVTKKGPGPLSSEPFFLFIQVKELFFYLEFLGFNTVLMDFVVDDTQAGIEFLGCSGLVSAGSLQGFDYQFTLKIFYSPSQRQALF